MALDVNSLSANDLEALRAALLSQAQNSTPPVPETPPLTLKDVLLLLVRHSRLPDEKTMNQCYAAIDEAYPDTITDEKSDNV